MLDRDMFNKINTQLEAAVSLPFRECPFCGEDKLEVHDIADLGFYVTCETCSSDGPTGESKLEAIMLWNSRK
jgi:Lar family restriction alleviation protein